MANRRRFGGDFKAEQHWKCCAGTRPFRRSLTRHKVHPNQVSAWKLWAAAGMKEVFANEAERGWGDEEAKIQFCTRRPGS